MARQLGLDLPGVTALGRADFLVAPSNALAFGMIEAWQEWTARKLVLSGPVGSGKTHLAHVWASLSGARIVAARDLREADVPALVRTHLAIEDVPEIAGDADRQRTLFHLHNLALAEGRALLFTGERTPRHWRLDLADLSSRLQATPVARIDPPDDALLSAVLAKLLADRQLTPNADLIPFLVSRIDRSFAAAGDIVARLDAASLALKRPVTRSLAAAVLDNRLPDAR